MTLNKGETPTHIDDAVLRRVDGDHGEVVHHECEFVALTTNFRVPTQITFSNSLCFSLSERKLFPVPIYVICDYYIHKTDLAPFPKNWNVHSK